MPTFEMRTSFRMVSDYTSGEGSHHIDKVIDINQSPIDGHPDRIRDYIKPGTKSITYSQMRGQGSYYQPGGSASTSREDDARRAKEWLESTRNGLPSDVWVQCPVCEDDGSPRNPAGPVS